MKRKINLKKLSVIFYWLVFLSLLVLFFTNDFGLVDIHKTSIITAVGIDMQDDEVQVTAEIAVPQPSQSGENVKYAQVQGSGLTIADALNEINAKTGFYPKLQFCRLILIGESCLENHLFRVLGCFYRKNYSELTAQAATCKGSAKDMLALKSNVSDMTSEAILKVLSDEVEKSANGMSTNLKDIALQQYSKSAACCLSYVEATKPGTSENGGNGDNVGGESGQSGSGEKGGQGGGSQGEQSKGGQSEGGGGGESGQSGDSSSGGGMEKPVEFSARKLAYFSDGKFKGIFDEQQSFALSLLQHNVRLAVLPCDSDGVHYTLGLKDVSSGVNLKVENGVPVVKFSFSGYARVQGAKIPVDKQETYKDDVVPPPVRESAEKVLEDRFESLYEECKNSDCDVLGLKELLYKYNYKYYDAFKDDLLNRARVKFEINVRSEN